MTLSSIYATSSTNKGIIIHNNKSNETNNRFYIQPGTCAADDDCDGTDACKADNTCGTYFYILI